MAVNLGFGADFTKNDGSTNVSGTQSSKKVLSQTAVDKIISDVLGGDQGLGSLAKGENVSGLSGTSVKAQLASDLVSKIVGEIANVTAETQTTFTQDQDTQSTQKKASGGLKTVICSELLLQGKLDQDLYTAATHHTSKLALQTRVGYLAWANKVVARMKQSERLSNFLLPIVVARYEHITGRRTNLLGALTVYIGQPICYLIGIFVVRKLLGANDARNYS